MYFRVVAVEFNRVSYEFRKTNERSHLLCLVPCPLFGRIIHPLQLIDYFVKCPVYIFNHFSCLKHIAIVCICNFSIF